MKKAAAKKSLKKAANLLYFVISIVILILLVEHFGKWGVFGFVGFCIAYALWIIFSRFKNFMMVMRQVETKIWGKPLDKKFWGKGELKRTKLKIVWLKKGESDVQNKHETIVKQDKGQQDSIQDTETSKDAAAISKAV